MHSEKKTYATKKAVTLIMPSPDFDITTCQSYWLWMAALIQFIIFLKIMQYCCQPEEQESTPPQSNNEIQSRSQNADASQNDTNNIQITLAEKTQQKSLNFPSFKSFQIKFTITFLLAMFSDWLTGAHLIQLYNDYIKEQDNLKLFGKLQINAIAILFIIGFASSAFVSTFIGSIADKFGRKKICLLFCITYAVCALIKHSDNYAALLFARFLGGLSTSILFSCFESWMISEHHNLGFPSSKLGSTFQLVWGLNSIVAILAGFVSQWTYTFYKENFEVTGDNARVGNFIKVKTATIGPFDLSALFLGVTFIMILTFWKNENYGDSRIEIRESLRNTMKVLFDAKDYNTVILGVLSACFEGGMYIFVYKWWDTLHSNHRGGIKDIAGSIFTVLMMGCLVGTTLNGTLKRLKDEVKVVLFCGVSGMIFFAQRWYYFNGENRWSYESNFAGFIVFEIAVGMYWPIIGGLRERYIPDEVRATVMNLFRIPLNLVVVVGLLFEKMLGKGIFTVLGMLMIVASLCALKLCFADTDDDKIEVEEDKREIDGEGMDIDGDTDTQV